MDASLLCPNSNRRPPAVGECRQSCAGRNTCQIRKPERRLLAIHCDGFASNLWNVAHKCDGNFPLFSLWNNGCDREGCLKIEVEAERQCTVCSLPSRGRVGEEW